MPRNSIQGLAPSKQKLKASLKKLGGRYPNADAALIKSVYVEEAEYDMKQAESILAALSSQGVFAEPEPVASPALSPEAQEELDGLCAAFPSLDEDVVVAVYLEGGRDAEQAVSSLLVLATRDDDLHFYPAIPSHSTASATYHPHPRTRVRVRKRRVQGGGSMGPLFPGGGGGGGEERHPTEILSARFPSVDASLIAILLEEAGGDLGMAMAHLSMLDPDSAEGVPGGEQQESEQHEYEYEYEYEDGDGMGEEADSHAAFFGEIEKGVFVVSPSMGKSWNEEDVGEDGGGGEDAGDMMDDVFSPVGQIESADTDRGMLNAMFEGVEDDVLDVIWEDADGDLGDAIDQLLDLINGTSYSLGDGDGGEGSSAFTDFEDLRSHPSDEDLAEMCTRFPSCDPMFLGAFLESSNNDLKAATEAIVRFLDEDAGVSSASSSTSGSASGTRRKGGEFPELRATLSTKGTWSSFRKNANMPYQGPSLVPGTEPKNVIVNGEDMATALRRTRLHEKLAATRVSASALDETFDQCGGDEGKTLARLALTYPGVARMVTRERAIQLRKEADAKAARAASLRGPGSSMGRARLVVTEVGPKSYRRGQHAHLQAGADSSVGRGMESLFSESQRIRKERGAAFAAATNAYRAGKGALAAKLAAQGRSLDRQLKALNSQRVSSILSKQDAFTSTGHKIDLHGLYVREALNALSQYLLRHRTACSESPCLITVVTGVGNHSKSKAKLRPAVRQFFIDHDYGFREERPGVYAVWAP